LKKAGAYLASGDSQNAFYSYSQALVVASVADGGRMTSRSITAILVKLVYLAVELGDDAPALRFFDKVRPRGTRKTRFTVTPRPWPWRPLRMGDG